VTAVTPGQRYTGKEELKDAGSSFMLGLGEAGYALPMLFSPSENLSNFLEKQHQEFADYWGQPKTASGGYAAVLGSILGGAALNPEAPAAVTNVAKGTVQGLATGANRLASSVANELGQVGTIIQTSNLATPLDRMLVTKAGLYHASRDPVGLMTTGPGLLNKSRIADEMAQAAIRLTPRQTLAMTHAAPYGYGEGPVLFKVHPTAEAYNARLNLGDPATLSRTAEDISHISRVLPEGEVTQKEYAFMSPTTTTATDKVLRRYPLVDARSLTKGKIAELLERQPKGSAGRIWGEHLHAAAGEQQVAVTQPGAVSKMTGHVVNEHLDEGTMTRDLHKFVEADVEQGMTRRLKFIKPKSIRGAFASKISDQVRRLQGEMIDQARILGYQKTGPGTFERAPLPEPPAEAIPGTSIRPRSRFTRYQSDKFAEELKKSIKAIFDPTSPKDMLDAFDKFNQQPGGGK